MSKGEYRYLYGPVPSRRLGLSLGVDIVPFKVCSYDCIYCQLGRTTHLTVDPAELVDAEAVVSELERWLAEGNTADYITFAGSGEPTLNSDLGEMIERVKQLTEIPIAVITNGSLLSNPRVMDAVSRADVLLPSLDAGTEETLQRVNRPCEGLTFESVVGGLLLLKQEFRGGVWLEVMLVHGMNDSDVELAAIAAIADTMNPDKVQINTVERPSRSGSVSAVSQETLEKACKIFGPVSKVIAHRPVASRAHQLGTSKDAMLNLLRRRPCRLSDIVLGTGMHIHEAVKILRSLMADGLVESIGQAVDPYYRPAIHAVVEGTPEDA